MFVNYLGILYYIKTVSDFVCKIYNNKNLLRGTSKIYTEGDAPK